MTDGTPADDLSYVESFSPGHGYLPARASQAGGGVRVSLDGTWKFRYCPGPAGLTPGFEAPDFDDAGFDELAVPSMWQLAGLPGSPGDGPPRYGTPAYTNVVYPFPVDPPRVPGDNPAGEYRRHFTLPPEWDYGGAAVIRFDGVDSCFAVFVNGTAVGHSKGSRLIREFDVTDLLRPGGNVIAVRVHQWSAGSYLEDQDMWWLSGIFRSVTLISEPPGAIRDFFVHADYDAASGTATLRVDADGPARRTVSVPELGLAGAAAGTGHRLPAVEPWSDEQPRLYDAVLSGPGGDIAFRVGFRRVEVRDGLIRLNGRTVQLPRREPARVAPRDGPHPGRGHHAGGRPADEAAQRQRGPDQPLPAGSAVPRPVRRVRAAGDRRVRPGDPRLRPERLARQPQRRSPVAARPAWTASSAPSSGTRTTPA